uniref:Uncharacterized protein n=1 Tax=Alexandrium andersonii TaxID=327968 RepID=A0A7S2H546_9DINO|mmetsp:Transcript_67811/g.151884  ORF Transcript_67811/g.151884 Transcript_67811/m.151884 type:complete len:161 (+) Transcript_67811:3-485(+)
MRVLGARSFSRSSSSSKSHESDLMHQLAKAHLAQEDLADSASASSAGGTGEAPATMPLAGLRSAHEEREGATLGACGWLHGPEGEAKSFRPSTQELAEGPQSDKNPELAPTPEQPWWWARLFGSAFCCTRLPPPTGYARRPTPPSGVPPLVKLVHPSPTS